MLRKLFSQFIVLAVLLAVFGVVRVSSALAAGCQPDLSSASERLRVAQSAIDAGKTDDALKSIGEARAALQLLESQCANYAPDEAGNSRSNPVPFGERQHVEIGKDFSGSIQLTEFLSGTAAQDYVKNANSRNEDAPDGTQYLVYRMKYACEKASDESCSFSRVFFDVVGDKGVTYEFTSISKHNISVRDIGEEQEIFGTTEIAVDVAFVVDVDDSNFVLLTAKSSKPRVFFDSQ